MIKGEMCTSKIINYVVVFGLAGCSHFDYVTKWTDMSGNFADEEALKAANAKVSCRFNKAQQDYYTYRAHRETFPAGTIHQGSQAMAYPNYTLAEAYRCMLKNGFEEREISKDDPRLSVNEKNS